ncbi:MAG: hypothetical protein E6K78_09595 [Candidatus Eisenbacteria bacterium]|uniref:Uncharacterized protein n=1 Tax=Eiseniibacteriota bacterium TaxID=2212470 RepID=A0A538TKW3_UNCEI|nr:MAG: hypothetical protein E6K78_09595 [Candidatus Eisenbacteria bacterium]
MQEDRRHAVPRGAVSARPRAARAARDPGLRGARRPGAHRVRGWSHARGAQPAVERGGGCVS